MGSVQEICISIAHVLDEVAVLEKKKQSGYLGRRVSSDAHSPFPIVQ